MRFAYELAQRMGRTVAELEQSMSAAEFERHLLLELVKARERQEAQDA